MGYEIGQRPEEILLFIGDGTAFYILNCENKMIDGIPHHEMMLEPIGEWVMEQLSISDKIKDTLSFERSEYGHLTRLYPIANFIPVSLNPEMPIRIALCNFEGDVINWEKFWKFIEIVDANSAKDRRIMALEEEVETYKSAHRDILRAYSQLSKQVGSTPVKEQIVLPESILGMKFKGNKGDVG